MRRNKITPEKLVVKVEMLMATGKDVIIVEGLNDVTLFKKMFNLEKCQIMQCDGKNNVNKLINLLKNRKSKSYFGLIDSDFDNYLGKPEDDKIFKTDTHDVETMIIFDTEHFLDLLASYIDLEKYENSFDDDIIGFILDLSYKIGLVRLINEEKGWSIDFGEYEVEDLIYNKKVKNLEEVFSYFCRDQTKLIEFINKIDNRILYPGNLDLCKQLCCGHDIMKISVYTINTFCKLKEIHFSTFEEILRQKYTFDEFTQTSVFKKIKNYNEELVILPKAYFTFDSIFNQKSQQPL